MKRALLVIPLLAIVLALPFAWAAPSHIFEHPASLPDQASDEAREALAARGSHGGGDGDNNQGSDNAADVDPGNSVTVTRSVSNDVVNLDITITVTPGNGVVRDWHLSVDPPGADKVPPVGPPSEVPKGPPDDVPRGPPA